MHGLARVPGSTLRRSIHSKGRERTLLKRISDVFERYPYRANAVSGLMLGAAGDVACQVIFEGKDWDTFGWRRFMALTVFSGIYSSAVYVPLFNMYPKILPAVLKTTPLRQGLSISVLDASTHSPLFYLPLYYLWMGQATGETLEESKTKYFAQFKGMATTIMMYWIPVQAVNFALLPPKQRVLFVCTANLVWTCVIDFMTNQKAHRKVPVSQ